MKQQHCHQTLKLCFIGLFYADKDFEKGEVVSFFEPHRVFIAKRELLAGEELFVDYGSGKSSRYILSKSSSLIYRICQILEEQKAFIDEKTELKSGGTGGATGAKGGKGKSKKKNKKDSSPDNLSSAVAPVTMTVNELLAHMLPEVFSLYRNKKAKLETNPLLDSDSKEVGTQMFKHVAQRKIKGSQPKETFRRDLKREFDRCIKKGKLFNGWRLRCIKKQETAEQTEKLPYITNIVKLFQDREGTTSVYRNTNVVDQYYLEEVEKDHLPWSFFSHLAKRTEADQEFQKDYSKNQKTKKKKASRDQKDEKHVPSKSPFNSGKTIPPNVFYPPDNGNDSGNLDNFGIQSTPLTFDQRPQPNKKKKKSKEDPRDEFEPPETPTNEDSDDSESENKDSTEEKKTSIGPLPPQTLDDEEDMYFPSLDDDTLNPEWNKLLEPNKSGGTTGKKSKLKPLKSTQSLKPTRLLKPTQLLKPAKTKAKNSQQPKTPSKPLTRMKPSQRTGKKTSK